MKARPSDGPGARDRRVAFAGLLGLCALLSSFVAWMVWPGLMSYDSLKAFEEATTGITTVVWPPMHAYLLDLGKWLPFAPGSLIFAQVLLLTGAGVVLAFRLYGSTFRAICASVVYLGALILSPSVMGSLAVHWRDPLTAAFLVLAAAAWIGPPGRASWLGLLLGSIAATVCLALRYNAFPVLAPLVGLMVFRVWRYPPAFPGRLAAILILLAPFPLALASVTWRLPDFQRMPAATNLSTTRLHDVVGVGACSGISHLPSVPGSPGVTPPDVLRQVYTPVHVNLVVARLESLGYAPQSLAGEALRKSWVEAVSQDPVCFLSHRRLVLLAQVGALEGDPFYLMHAQIDPNRFGFQLARPEAAAAYVRGVSRLAHPYWNRPVIVLTLSLVLMILSFRAAPERRLVKLALALGSVGYTGVLFLVSPAADARYIVPALAAAALLSAISAADLVRVGRTEAAT